MIRVMHVLMKLFEEIGFHHVVFGGEEKKVDWRSSNSGLKDFFGVVTVKSSRTMKLEF